MDIAFPMRGLDTNHPRNQQPEGTSPDLLNVLPFDRDYRGRGAIRPGLSKFINTQLGNGSQPVLLVQQVTTALDPSSIAPSTLLYTKSFAGFADTTDLAVQDTNWKTGTGGSVDFPVDTSHQATGKVKALHGYLWAPSATTTGAAVYQPALTLGPSYIVKATIRFDVSASTSTGGYVDDGFTLYTRLDKTTVAGIAAQVSRGSIRISTPNGSTNSTELAVFNFASALTANVDHTFEIHATGDTFAAFIDGVQYVSYTTATASGNSGVGFGVGRNTHSSSDTWGLKDFFVYAGVPLAAYRQTSVVAVCGTNIYVGDTASLAAASGGTGVLSETIKPQMASSKGICYFVDSQHSLKTLNLNTKTVADISVSTGTETAATLGAYSLACTWRDRLVLASSAATPQNFIMSRQGTQTDWDYSQTDAAAAVAGNAAKAGAIGEPLNCLIPWTDDILILGGDHSLYKVEGDIASGGQILLLSDAVGTLGPDCWDADPQGNVYFVGSGGLYRLTPSGLPENLANDTVKNIFANINRVTTYVVLSWDRDRNGLHIHLTPVNSGSATHIFYDATTQGFFPIQYPDTIGPLTAVVYDGDGPADRQVILATRDGYIRKIDPTSLTDDGTAITSYVKIGPFRPAGDAALSVMEGIEVLLGDAPVGFVETDFQVQLSVQTGKDAYTVLTSPEKTIQFSFTKQSRRKRLLQRVAGGSFVFTFTGISGKLWSLEKLVVLFTEGGLQRRY